MHQKRTGSVISTLSLRTPLPSHTPGGKHTRPSKFSKTKPYVWYSSRVKSDSQLLGHAFHTSR